MTLSLQELFNDRIFRVPDYQRGYAWERLQVQEFLDDLSLLVPPRRHYTGTIVLRQISDSAKEDSGGRRYHEAHIVDGQQRLTTIVLLLNEVAAALANCEGSRTLAEGTRNSYVEAVGLDEQPLYKLTLNADVDQFFKTSVLPDVAGIEGAPVKSAQRLLDAKKQIAAYLDEAEGHHADREQWLRNLRTKVTSQLQFSLYEVERKSEVGVIFEVMNDRGKLLSDLEKVKNYLLYTAYSLDLEDRRHAEEFAELVNHAWADLLTRMMKAGLGSPADEDQLLRAHWFMRYDARSRHWKGSRSIKQHFDLRKYRGRHSNLLGELKAYVEGLREACISYCDIRRPGRELAFESFAFDEKKRSDIVLWSLKLARIEVIRAFLPLLMATRKQWSSEPEKYLEMLRVCEVLAFRTYSIGGFRANFRESDMFHLAHEVAQGGADFTEVIRRVKSAYRWRGAREHFDNFVDASKPRPVDDRWWESLGYFLYEYERHLADSRQIEPKVTWDELRREISGSIEHVLPQSIENQPEWLKRFPDAHEEYVNDIGNLVLSKLEWNSTYGNKSFSQKKGSLGAKSEDGSDVRCYANSPWLQEQELAQYDDWTVESIEKRRHKLLDWARERWGVDFGDVSDSMVEAEYEDAEEELEEDEE